MAAASKMMIAVLASIDGMIKRGKPVGIAPRIGMPSIDRPMTVPVTSAASGAGMTLPQVAGQLKTIASVSNPKNSAPK